MFKNIIQKSVEITDITLDEFLLTISEYESFDQALSELDESYLQFYIDNQNILDKSIYNQSLFESEETNYSGWSAPEGQRFKTIKYKGEYITLEYEPELESWFPSVRFRSIVSAMKYGKALADSILIPYKI